MVNSQKLLKAIRAIRFTDVFYGEGACIIGGAVWQTQGNVLTISDIAPRLKRYGVSDIIVFEWCETLHAVATYPYFYEWLAGVNTKQLKRLEQQGIIEVYFLGYLKSMHDYYDRADNRYQWYRYAGQDAWVKSYEIFD